MEILESDKKFKAAVGAFVISFSELEIGLASLGIFTISDPRYHNQYLPEFISYNLSKKSAIITSFIKTNLPELLDDWTKINIKIGNLNRFRRFIVHGIASYTLANKMSVKSYIKENGEIVEHLLTLNEILMKVKELSILRTGVNGTEGHFRQKFIIARINLWNELVKPEFKIIYKTS